MGREQRHIDRMAARDRYPITVKCPKCGRSGEGEASEDDHPWMRHPGFSIDELPDGFLVVEHSNYRAKTRIKCECGEVFPA